MNDEMHDQIQRLQTFEKKNEKEIKLLEKNNYNVHELEKYR